MPLLSIITPVYNVEKQLPGCLDSIIAQRFADWELIAVNDGSTDGSGAIIDAYARRDSRIRAIHKSNGGVSSARNMGLANALGRFIGFVDGDDTLHPEMYERMMAAMDGCDLVQCDYCNVDPAGNRIPDHALQSEAHWSGTDAVLNACMENKLVSSVCTKLFRRELVGDLRFDRSLAVSEDMQFTMKACMRVKAARRIAFEGYFYLQHDASATHQALNQKQLGRSDAARWLLDTFHGMPAVYPAAARRAAVETCNCIDLILLHQKFTERLPELRQLALRERGMLLADSRAPRKLRVRLQMLHRLPGVYYRLYTLFSHLKHR